MCKQSRFRRLACYVSTWDGCSPWLRLSTIFTHINFLQCLKAGIREMLSQSPHMRPAFLTSAQMTKTALLM